MALEDLIGVIGKASYSYRTLNLDLQGQHAFASLSSPARVFLFLAMGLQEEGPVSIKQLYGRRWLEDSRTLEHFRQLSEEVRAEVLVFVTLLLHETVHHVDLLSTPFGLNYHMKTIKEYWNLQNFGPILLENPELIPDKARNERLVDFDSVRNRVVNSTPEELRIPRYSLREWNSEELNKTWHSLRGQILTVEAWGIDIPPGKNQIKEICGDKNQTFRLFNQELQRVTVNGFLATIAMQEDENWYLRPTTLLETRAVANSMQWVIYLLGKDGAQALPHYFNVLYNRPYQYPDYWFLFDLIAKGWEFASFENLLQKANQDLIDHVLQMLSCACWYALQAPPLMEETGISVLTSNPMIRLELILSVWDDFRTGKISRRFESFVEVANALDKSEIGRKAGTRPISDILSFCGEASQAMIKLNRQWTLNPDMRDHFEYILTLLKDQLTGRNDYTSYMGMPDHGNPFYCPGKSQNLKLLNHLFAAYKLSDAVQSWFEFRVRFWFGFIERKEAIEKLERHFGMDELIIPCPCGTNFSGRLSRYSNRIQKKCPNPKCKRIHDIDPKEIAKINSEELAKFSDKLS